MKHITLSTDRPEATKPGTVFIGYEKSQETEFEKQQHDCQQYVPIPYIRPQKAKSYIAKFIKANEMKSKHRNDLVGDMTPAIGSDEDIYASRDYGFLETVLMAYNHHWNLRTSPEDWWYCVTLRVAKAIDENSKKESVRKMFVNHEGKKELTVRVPGATIYNVNYTYFFNEMEKLISASVNVPEYVDCVTADFSTTTLVQRAVSQITLMSSLQEFFEFRLDTRCGIPAIEMLGTDEDWMKLLSKLEVLKAVLEPIEKDLDLGEEWWSHVKEVFSKLLDTFRGRLDQDWWSRIISRMHFDSGKPMRYFGWLVQFIQGSSDVAEDKISSGLVSTPLTILTPLYTDKGTLVAGIIGYTVHDEEATENNRVSVQPFHGWSLMLPENSPLRSAKSEREPESNPAEHMHGNPEMMIIRET